MCHKSGNGANARTNRLICPSVRGSQLTLLPSADFNQVVKQASAQPAPECKWQRLRKKLCWRPARRKIDLAASLWKVCLCFIIHLCYQRPFRQLFVIEWKPHLSSRIISSCHLLLLSMFPSLPPSLTTLLVFRYRCQLDRFQYWCQLRLFFQPTSYRVGIRPRKEKLHHILLIYLFIDWI